MNRKSRFFDNNILKSSMKTIPFPGIESSILQSAHASLADQHSIPQSPGKRSGETYELCLGASIVHAATRVRRGAGAAYEFINRLEYGGTKETILEQATSLGLDAETIRAAIARNDNTPAEDRHEAFMPMLAAA
jgi:hypothetical protein